VKKKTEGSQIPQEQSLAHMERLAVIGRLSASIIHDINNPVSFITSNSTTLLKYANRIKELISLYEKGFDKAFIEKYKKRNKLDLMLADIDNLIMQNIDGLAHVSEVIGNLKKFAKDDSDPSFNNADIAEVIRNILIIARKEISQSVSLHTYLHTLKPVACNVREIGQVVLNIALNAAEALQESPQKTKQIEITTFQDEQWTGFSIRDNGPGIDETVKKHIFTPFFTTKGKDKGTGLGLHIAHEIITRHHKGQILIEPNTRDDSGTVFIVKIPSQSQNKE